MENKISVEDMLSKVKMQDGNDICFDCGEVNPEWASVNNGILICYKCAGIHRGFGRKISIVASIILDEFDFNSASLLLFGGNTNFAEFLSKYNINTQDSLEMKYKSRASQFYRVALQSKVKNEELPKELSLELGRELVAINVENNFDNKDVKGNNVQKEEDEGFFGSLKKGLSKAGEVFCSTGDALGKKMEEFGVTGALNSGANFVQEKTTSVIVID